MKKLLFGALAIVVLVFIAGGVWYFVIDDDPVEKATTDCGEQGCAESTVDSIDGSWSVVTADSEGTLVITETIGGVADHEAEGKTGDITGSLEIAGSAVTEATFSVDMTALEFTDSPSVGDVGNRANAMKTSGLQTNDFPEATFELTSPIELGDDPTSGDPVVADAAGDLTIHGVTKPITFSVEVVADGDTFKVTPTDFIPVVLADYEMTVSAPGFVADISDEGSFDFLLVFEQA